jgi:formylglycine-generating enzyme required for sulfatase activity
VRAEWQIHLPTEWEWQWVAQNGVEARIYPWGEWDDYPRANTTEAGIGDRSIAVGMYPYGATECGAFDVAGNLWEWCLNDYDNPEITNGHSNNNKTLRGGSFHGYRTLARAGYRGSSSPGYWGLNRGFRVDVALLLPSLSSGTLDSDSL